MAYKLKVQYNNNVLNDSIKRTIKRNYLACSEIYMRKYLHINLKKI